MSTFSRLFEELVSRLGKEGFDDVELYSKEGRSRRLETVPVAASGRRALRRVELRSEEVGWAVRAGGAKGAIFACGTGNAVPDGPWPAPYGEPLQLPALRAAGEVAADEAAPLIVESEALDRVEAFERALATEADGARLVRAVVDDGRSEARLESTRGVDCVTHIRAGAVYLEVVADGLQRSLQLATRAAVGVDFEAQARRLGTLLSVMRARGQAPTEAGPMVLAPAVGVSLLEGLLPLLVGGDGWRCARRLRDRRGQVASEALSIVDDGGLPGGLLAAAVDGEGVPTRLVRLIENGRYRQPLLSWHEASPGRGEGSGCMLRPSWRRPPQPGPTHLFVEPHREVSPADLIGSVGTGYYWIDVRGSGLFDLTRDHFELPVMGFRLRRGRASDPVARAVLKGSIGELLRSVRGVARDLNFSPRRSLLGAPTMLLEGLSLDPATSPG